MDEFDYFLQQAAGRQRKLSACPTELSGSLPCIADLQEKKETGFQFDRRTPAMNILSSQSAGQRKSNGLLDVPVIGQDCLIGSGLRRSRSDSGVSGQEVGLLCSPCSPTLGRKIRSMKSVWSSLKDIMVHDNKPKSQSRPKPPEVKVDLSRASSTSKINSDKEQTDLQAEGESGLKRSRSAKSRWSFRRKQQMTRQESEIAPLAKTQVEIHKMPLSKSASSSKPVRRSSSVKLRKSNSTRSKNPVNLGRSSSFKMLRRKVTEAGEECRRGTVHSDDAVIVQRSVQRRAASTNSSQTDDTLPSTECYRVRNFDITRKGVINRGDSFLSRSTSVTSLGSSYDSLDFSRKQSDDFDDDIGEVFAEMQSYKVLILGARGVGKTTLMKQFHTSDCVQAKYATLASIDSEVNAEVHSLAVPVSIGNVERLIRFVDVGLDQDWQTEKNIDGYVILYDCTQRETFHRAVDILHTIKKENAINKTLIIVANKADLVRTREVSSHEGSVIAETYKCKYIEVSAWMNLSVDDLLVGVLNQIQNQKGIGRIDGRKSPLVMILGKFLKRQRTNSKSCENLLK